jgi:hypothetical protein
MLDFAASCGANQSRAAADIAIAFLGDLTDRAQPVTDLRRTSKKKEEGKLHGSLVRSFGRRST